MKRPHSELRIPGGDSHAEFVLSQMEAAARSGTDGAARIIAGKWLAVFVDGDGLVYDWDARIVSRKAALSLLAKG